MNVLYYKYVWKCPECGESIFYVRSMMMTPRMVPRNVLFIDIRTGRHPQAGSPGPFCFRCKWVCPPWNQIRVETFNSWLHELKIPVPVNMSRGEIVTKWRPEQIWEEPETIKQAMHEFLPSDHAWISLIEEYSVNYQTSTLEPAYTAMQTLHNFINTGLVCPDPNCGNGYLSPGDYRCSMCGTKFDVEVKE